MPSDPAAKLSVLIGAESLMLTRSGVGRMTFEIARAAWLSPEVATLTLLLEQSLSPVDSIDMLDHQALGTALPPPTPIPWKVALGRVPGVQTLRRIKHGGLNRRLRELARQSGDRLVYHEPNMIARPIALPTVVTINDLSWHHQPGWHPSERLRWIHRNLPGTLRRARRFVAISQFTKDGAVRDLGVPAERVDVVPLAPAAEFAPVAAAAAAAVLQRFDLVDRSYVFSTSTLEPRKNFDRLLAAHGALPPRLRARAPLVIAGGKGWGDVLSHPQASAAIRDGSVRLLGHVTDADLVPLCARAAVFGYVSLYEGFGLPVVEAMAAGTPVLASSTTAVGELAGDAALQVDPEDTAAISAGLGRLLTDPALSEQLRQAGLAHAAGFTWQRTLACLLASWSRALE